MMMILIEVIDRPDDESDEISSLTEAIFVPFASLISMESDFDVYNRAPSVVKRGERERMDYLRPRIKLPRSTFTNSVYNRVRPCTTEYAPYYGRIFT